MAAVSHQDADRYLARPSSGHFVFLVFGTDQGLVFERCQKLLRGAIEDGDDAIQQIDLLGDQISADPLALVDEANSISLFGGPRRAIRIQAGAKSILPALDKIALAPPDDCIIVIVAGELKRDAPLRKWVEKQSFAASIECRSDDARDLQRLIDTELRAVAITIAPDAREALGAMLGEDRLSTRSELSKLILYVHGQPSVTIEHINEILHDASALSVDVALSAVFSGRPALALEGVNRALHLGVDVQMLLAAALRYAISLHRSRAEIDSGASFDDNLQMLLRQFSGYSRKAEIAAQLRDVPLVKLEQIVAAINKAIKTARQSNFLSEERITRLFLSLATSLRQA